LLRVYREIGPAGEFGAMMIEAAIKQADEAMVSGDIIRILAAYENLRGLK